MTEAVEKQRTIQDAEKKLVEVAAATERLQSEEQKISDHLSLGLEPSVLVAAALENKSPATSAKTMKLETRRTEIQDQLKALGNHERRLKVERAGLLMAEAEAEAQRTAEAFTSADEAFREAEAARNQASNEAAWAKEKIAGLREQQQRLESDLWQHDASYREEAEAERQRRIEENKLTEEQKEAYREQINREVFGRVSLPDDPEQVARMAAEAHRQGGRIVPLSGGMRRVYPEPD